MASKQGPIGELAERIIAANPDHPARGLARLLREKSKKAITLEQARSAIRYRLGQNGVYKRKKRPMARPPRQPGQMVSMPSSKAESWTPHDMGVVGRVAAGMPMCSDEEIIRRHDICRTCEFLVDDACTQCGCPVSRVAGYVSKLSWADQECPVGKWGKVERHPTPG